MNARFHFDKLHFLLKSHHYDFLVMSHHMPLVEVLVDTQKIAHSFSKAHMLAGDKGSENNYWDFSRDRNWKAGRPL